MPEPQPTTGDVPTQLSTFAEWLRETDHHAEYHLSLIEQVAQYCAASDGDRAEGDALADRLERWRYQYLQEAVAAGTPHNRRFAVALNATANDLRGQSELKPRETRDAIRSNDWPSARLAEAAEALSTDYPLDRLTASATETTALFFGSGSSRWPVLLYAPIYVSSHCVNHCTYCGFRYPLEVDRRHLSMPEIQQQIDLLKEHGFGHLLVVGGEFPKLTTTEYYCEIVASLAAQGVAPAIEIAPQSTVAYAALANAGACGVTLYQETYDEQLYDEYHPRGPKSHYLWRLESHDRVAEAGIRRLGLGTLLGLANPEHDMSALMRHGAYLANRFPECTLAFSLPRIHEAPEGFQIPYSVTDDQLIRYYCVLRLAFPQAILVLSTRESAGLRNRLAQLCITQMSAGSSTTPGGYGEEESTNGKQFPVADHRSPGEVAQWLQESGFEVTWS